MCVYISNVQLLFFRTKSLPPPGHIIKLDPLYIYKKEGKHKTPKSSNHVENTTACMRIDVQRKQYSFPHHNRFRKLSDTVVKKNTGTRSNSFIT